MVFHDIFDSFEEHIEFWSDFTRDLTNVRVILFNLPGQALTKFNPEKIYTNVVIS